MYTLRPSTNRGLDHRTILEMERKMNEQAKRNKVVKHLTVGNVKGKIGGWKLVLNAIFQIFEVRWSCSYFVVINHSLIDRAGPGP